MHPISWVGVAILLAGVGLFARSQFTAPADKAVGEAKVWKVNITGPPSLLLAALGAFVLLFPFTPLFGPPEESVLALPEETPVETTVTVQVGDTSTTAEATALPPAPFDFEILVDDPSCEGDVISWFQEGEVLGWYVLIDIYGADDQYVDTIELDAPAGWLCQWDFFHAEDAYYYLYVYSYDEVNYSADALIIAYP